MNEQIVIIVIISDRRTEIKAVSKAVPDKIRPHHNHTAIQAMPSASFVCLSQPSVACTLKIKSKIIELKKK